jgi:transcriptional regulator with XRE-family HTH domain
MDNLKSLREERGISQQRLAEQIGTNQQNIHRYENKYYEPDIKTLKLFANFFDTSIDYLVGNTGIKNKIECVEKFELNNSEALLMEKYRKLNAKAKAGVITFIDILLENS